MKGKRWLALLLVLILAVQCAPLAEAIAVQPSYNFVVEYDMGASAAYLLLYRFLPDGTIQILGAVPKSRQPETTPMKLLPIPSTINDVPVTNIADGAFENQHFIGPLVLPDTVTTIEKRAFRNFTCTESLTILPEALQQLGDEAFSGCSISDYYLNGKPFEVGASAFDVREDTLYAREDEAGFFLPPDYNASAGTWHGYQLGTWSGQTIDLRKLSANHQIIRVTDSSGTPLADASVICNGTEQKTDKEGQACFDRSAWQPRIAVSKEGYVAWTNRDSSWERSETGCDTVILYTEEEGSCMLGSARYSNYADLSKGCSVLTSTKKVSIGNRLPACGDLDFGKFYLRCRAVEPEKAKSYALYQGERCIAVSDDGEFSLATESFQEGGCFVRVTGKDQMVVDTPLNLLFVETAIQEVAEMNFSGNKMKFMVPDWVPFLGGSEFAAEFPLNIPVHAVIDETGKINVGFNINMKGEKNDAEMLEEAKETISDLKKMNKYDLANLSTRNKNTIKRLVKKQNELMFFKNGQIDFLGYGVLDPGANLVQGEVAMLFSVDAAKFGFNTVVAVVPVTVQVGLELGLNVVGELHYDWAHAAFVTGLDLTPYGELEAFGGVGADKLVGVGIYGSARLDGVFRVGTEWGLRSVDLTGELGLKAYVAMLEYKRSFAYQTWHLYTANTLSAMDAQPEAEIYSADGYAPMDLSYLEQTSPWRGESPSPLATSARMELQALQEAVYRDAQPVMIAGPDGLYGAFLSADPADRTVQVLVTKYNGTGWTSPAAVHRDAVLDSNPVLFAHDGTIYLAYTETKSGYQPDSLLSYAQNQQLVVGTLDPATLAFTKQKTWEGQYIRQPQFISSGGAPTLVWVDAAVSTENDVLFPPAGTIETASCSGSWSEAEPLCSFTKPILSMTPGTPGGVLTAACVLDRDADPRTTEDQQLYALTAGGETLLGSGTGTVRWDRLPGTAEPAFLWNEDAGLRSSDGTLLTMPGLTGEFRVLGNRLYYSAAGGGRANLTVSAFENGAWSEPFPLTGDSGYLERLNMACWNQQDYVMGLNARVVISETGVEDNKNLVFGPVLPVHDLVLETAAFEPAGMTPGSAVPVTLDIRNRGEQTVTSVTVSRNGAALGTYPCTIEPGQLTELQVNLTCPQNEETVTLSVAAPGQEDYTWENNKTTVVLAAADVTVTADYEQIGSSRTLVAAVQNRGVETAYGKVEFRTDSGLFLGMQSYSDLRPGEILQCRWELDEDLLHYEAVDVRIEADCLGTDAKDWNNAVVLHLPERPAAPDFATVQKVNGQLQVTLTKAVPGGTVICALIDGSGRMIGCHLQDAAPTMTFDMGAAAGFELCLLDRSFSPICPSLLKERAGTIR